MADLISNLMDRYGGLSLRGDGAPEINGLQYASFEPGGDDHVPAGARLALVLIEPRILQPIAGLGPDDDLLPRLERLKGDLRAEGLYSRFIVADVYHGSVPKDGSIVLALRRFFIDVKAAFPGFEGAILIGSFPEATLVRRWIWAPDWEVTIDGRLHRGERHMTIRPELVSTRTEIVLADLTGNWESLYHFPAVSIESIIAFPDAATARRSWTEGEAVRDGTFGSSEFIHTSDTFDDAFYVDDAEYTTTQLRLDPASRYLELSVRAVNRNPEVDPRDRTSANVLARPDISVSRINARNVAVNPDPSLRGDDGGGFLDDAGNPRTFSSAAPLFGDNQSLMFTHRDATLERRFYNTYLDRNHRFRTGAFSGQPFRTAAVSGTTDFVAADYARFLNDAASDFAPSAVAENATLLEYVRQLKQPAVLRYVIAHSSMWNSAFGSGYDTPSLEREFDGPPIRWVRDGTTYRPGMAGQGGTADLFVYRALWHNNTLRGAGAWMVIHGGCDVNSAYGTDSVPYSSPDYAGWQNAEGILFFTNTVALLSRAKVFNDAPWGFPQAFRTSDRANFGSCWRAYFNAQANDAGVVRDFAQNKRAYFWSMDGDWTLRLRNTNGLGILSARGPLVSERVHPDRAWIDGWNFDGGANEIRGVGDLDGDGVDEIVVTSDWGIGVAKHDGRKFRLDFGAPRDTWFGSWRWDATVNTGRDAIHGVQRYTSGHGKQILVTSSRGLAVLGLSGGALTPAVIHPNGTRLGGWAFDSTQNSIRGTGDFDGDGCQEVAVTSDWGIGLISLTASRERFMAPNGAWLGGWLYSRDTVIRLIGDVDGDGCDEIVVSSPWGIGVLKVVDGRLIAAAMYPHGTRLGAYTVGATDRFEAVDRFRGEDGKEVIAVNGSGLHLLAFTRGELTRVGGVSAGQRVDGWLYDPLANRIGATGAFSGSSRVELLVTSGWGVGILGFDGDGSPRCQTLHPYGATLGDWYLESQDQIRGAGVFTPGSHPQLLFVKRQL
jgi:hypothetical protein